MIFIAGAGPKIVRYRSNKSKYCFHCHNTTQWILQKTRYYVTLFFIPVIPVKTEYHHICPVCGNSMQLSEEEFEQEIKSARKID